MSSIKTMKPLNRARLAGALGLAFVSAALSDACKTPTQIKLDLTTDAKCKEVSDIGDHFVKVSIVAGRPGGIASLPPSAETESCTAKTPISEIGTLVFVPNDSGDQGVELLIAAGVVNVKGDRLSSEDCLQKVQSNTMAKGDPCIIARRRLGFVSNNKLELPIELETQCTGVVCDANSTCYNGSCTSDTASCDKATGVCELGGSTGAGGAGGTGGVGGIGPASVSTGSLSTSSVSTTDAEATANSQTAVSDGSGVVASSAGTMSSGTSSSAAGTSVNAASSSSGQMCDLGACGTCDPSHGTTAQCVGTLCECQCDLQACTLHCSQMATTVASCNATCNCNPPNQSSSVAGPLSSSLSSGQSSTSLMGMGGGGSAMPIQIGTGGACSNPGSGAGCP